MAPHPLDVVYQKDTRRLTFSCFLNERQGGPLAFLRQNR